MPLGVSDRGANKNELIDHAAEVLGRSIHKREVFRAIYTGKKKVKSVPELIKTTQLPHRRVLDAGKKLASQDLVEQTKVRGVTGYKKIDFFQTHRSRILRLANNPKARLRLPTKRRPLGGRLDSRPLTSRTKACRITIDDISTFQKARTIRNAQGFTRIPESKFKRGIAHILGEHGKFKDWGGEKGDLFSTRLKIKGKRRAAVFAFKGPGTKGKLTPGKMGKNGDQIQRLFHCPADVFLIQYWGQIDDSVLEQLETHAKAKAYYTPCDVWYGIIDGSDSTRLINGYPKAFRLTHPRR